MDFNSILEVKSVRDLSIKKAHKGLKKFLKANTNDNLMNFSLLNEERMNFLPDDLVDKLSVIISEIRDTKENEIIVESTPSVMIDQNKQEKLKTKTKKQKIDTTAMNNNNNINNNSNTTDLSNKKKKVKIEK